MEEIIKQSKELIETIRKNTNKLYSNQNTPEGVDNLNKCADLFEALLIFTGDLKKVNKNG